jgi:hypothetical protein
LSGLDRPLLIVATRRWGRELECRSGPVGGHDDPQNPEYDALYARYTLTLEPSVTYRGAFGVVVKREE